MENSKKQILNPNSDVFYAVFYWRLVLEIWDLLIWWFNIEHQMYEVS